MIRHVKIFDKTETRREEARKAVELQPQMSAEAKRMVTKLAVRVKKTSVITSV